MHVEPLLVLVSSCSFSPAPAGNHSISYTSCTPAIGATPPAQQYPTHIQNSTPQGIGNNYLRN